METNRVIKEKSILGQINDLSHRLVFMLVIPIVLSLVLMLIYAGKYHSSIKRMETIAGLKSPVVNEIPGAAWDIISGRNTFENSNIYLKIHEVNDVINTITDETASDNRLSLIVAGRTMQTMENYVDRLKENIASQVPVITNETIYVEINRVSSLVDSMLNEYIAQEIASAGSMSVSLRVIIILTAIVEIIIVLVCLIVRNRAVRSTAAFVRKPIEKLEEAAEKLSQGTLDARLADTDVTELRNLTTQVNTMAKNLNSMMEKSVLDAKKLRKAELRTMQAQINPHFLYNTLDAIVWKAEAGDKDEVIQLASALSDFFRISLSAGADWIPISQEKKHIEGYLKIQQTRYRDIMSYSIDIPDSIGDYYILKLLIQPLVENAIYHGIKIKRGGGHISVSAKEENGMLTFVVSDTGFGMTPEQLEALNDRMKKEQPTVGGASGGFGLVNVNLRIRLYYNQTEGLTIKSSPAGTDVSFTVPCRKREEIFENESVSG